MPIVITYQESSNSLNAAYRPIVYRCKANISGSTESNYIPPVVYCDIYLNSVFYKTMSKTQFINNDGIAPEYEFDIQDALQEVMSYNLPTIAGGNVLEFNNTTRKVYIKFRNAKFDSNGFINSEQLIPIQGTSSNIPVAGGGVQSNEIYVFNATVQHEDVQDLKTFLNNWKTGNWDVNTFPLTKRPKKIKLCKSDSSYFPIISSATVACLELRYRYKGDSFFQSLGYCYAEPVVNILTVTNVIKTNGSNYNIFFTANFTLNIIKAEVSIDGVNWSIPTTSPSLLSPYNRVISLGTPFYVRLINGLGANAVYSNIYTFN